MSAAAFIPASGLSTLTTPVTRPTFSSTPLRPSRRAPAAPRRASAPSMVAYPYTGSGYGAAGVPYGNNRVGQSFLATTTSDIVATAAAVPIFKTLVALLVETCLDYELSKGGPFTVFAPTDDAFAALLDPHGFRQLAPLLRPENRAALRAVLSYHVARGALSSGAAVAAGRTAVPTLLDGADVTVLGYNRRVSAAEAAVTRADIPCSNGVIHIVDKVMLPPGYAPPPAGPVEKKYPNSIVSDVYGRLLTPRQSLGIDAVPEGVSALTSFN